MTQSITKTPLYPKAHLLAASGIAALLSLSLLIFPAGEVEAKKTFISLDSTLDGTRSYDAGIAPPFSDGVENQADPFSQADMRIDSPLGKMGSPAPSPTTISVKVVSGDSLSTVFSRAGLSSASLAETLASDKRVRNLNIRPGQVFEFELSREGALQEARTKLHNHETITLKRTDKGLELEWAQPAIRTAYAQGVITSTLSDAATQAGLPYKAALGMADIFAYDIDFSKVTEGDQFEVLYEQRVINGEVVGSGDILAARFTNLRQTYTAIRYKDSYYNEKGISLRKAFLRTPVDFARISSRFSSGRKHPILNKIRAHQGVDYAAPRGTPIKAAGDGKVILAGRKGGYGNTVILQHGNSYKTLYAHMKGFAKGIRSGSSVKQGQVIGYIGTTGLSTGPHLHYEFQINGRHVDPLAQKSLMANPIASSDKSKFMALSKPLLARMNQEKSNAPQLAMSKR
jgi:murein DD-endopeptidase MepM/ murein hydrolase activator NlpD